MEKRFNFEKLATYQKSIELANLIYYSTEKFPKSEQYGLVNQLRRCASSIALNIAEGYGRYYKRLKKQFYSYARSSVYECVPIITISFNQEYIEEKEYKQLYNECFELSRMLSGLIKSVDNRKTE